MQITLDIDDKVADFFDSIPGRIDEISGGEMYTKEEWVKLQIIKFIRNTVQRIYQQQLFNKAEDEAKEVSKSLLIK